MFISAVIALSGCIDERNLPISNLFRDALHPPPRLLPTIRVLLIGGILSHIVLFSSANSNVDLSESVISSMT